MLVLLAALIIACAGGLALAVGLSLPAHRKQGVCKQVFANDHAFTFVPREHHQARASSGVHAKPSSVHTILNPKPPCPCSVRFLGRIDRRNPAGNQLIDDGRNG
jgi:hypothetical protein